MGKLGVLLIIVSVVVLIVSLLVPGALSPFGALYCKPGEKLTGVVSVVGSLRKSAVGTSYYCVDKEGAQRSVTSEVSVSTTLVFLVLLFGGMGLIAISSKGADSSTSNSPSAGGISLADLQSGTFGFESARSDKPLLADTLRQLEAARAQALITEEEYQRLRQEALDKLV